MKLKLSHFPFFLFAIVLFASCKKDHVTVEEPAVSNFSIPNVTPVSGRVSGIVVNENNAPVEAAEVTINGAVYTTDLNGVFHSNTLTLDKYITTVTVNKNGYFKGIRAFSATESRNFVSIKLIPKTLIGTLDAGNGGLITLSNNSTINFKADGFVVDGQTTSYSGPVNIYASYIDPTRSDFASLVPGSMMARDDQYLYMLQSAGMMAVELESNSGQALQLATNKPASISIAIPASLRSKAPTTIDTWSLNGQGIWSREGKGTRVGDYYQMEATHFSFWNVDMPSSAVFLTVNTRNQNGQPLSNALIQLSVINNTQWWATTAGITDSAGTAAGFVPANLDLELAAYANDLSCTTPFHSQSLGSFSTDATVNITVTLTPAQTISVSGSVTDCNNQPLVAGTAAILAGPFNLYYAPITNGTYSLLVPTCYASTTATLIVGDSISGDYSDPVSVQLTGSSVVVPTIAACNGTAAEYTFTGAPATCPSYVVTGTYAPNVTMNASNTMTISVEVTALGSYLIATNTINGIRFGASGTFTNPGTQTVTLLATGTPLNSGTFTYIPVGAGSNSQGCMKMITF